MSELFKIINYLQGYLKDKALKFLIKLGSSFYP